MKRFLALLLSLLLLIPSALAEPLPLGDALSGTAYWPEDADEESAVFVYHYSYPMIDGDDETAALINDFYHYLVDDALAFTVPMAAESVEGSDLQAYATVSTEITCNNDAWFSVKLTTESFMGAAVSTVVAGHTFAREGAKAGTVTSLPYLLGILAADETDTWLQERQTAKADDMVRGLVWEIIQEQLSTGAVAYYDDLTYDILEACFYPEEDFFLDEDGNPVFFVQESIVAPAAEGVLYFPFTMEELLDEI